MPWRRSIWQGMDKKPLAQKPLIITETDPDIEYHRKNLMEALKVPEECLLYGSSLSQYYRPRLDEKAFGRSVVAAAKRLELVQDAWLVDASQKDGVVKLGISVMQRVPVDHIKLNLNTTFEASKGSLGSEDIRFARTVMRLQREICSKFNLNTTFEATV